MVFAKEKVKVNVIISKFVMDCQEFYEYFDNKKFLCKFFFQKERSREKFHRKNAAKNMEEISFSIFLGCGKNKEFWPEYSPLTTVPWNVTKPLNRTSQGFP